MKTRRAGQAQMLRLATWGLAGCLACLGGCAGGMQTQSDANLPDVGHAFAAVGAMLGFGAAVGELERAGGDPTGPGPYSSSSLLDGGRAGW